MCARSHPPLDVWDPMGLDDVAAVFEGAPFRWWVAGGRALELHVGRQWRVHGDTDVGICRCEAGLAFEWLADWEMWIAAGGALSLWSGRTPSVGAGENNVWVRRRGVGMWCLDLTVGAGTATEWVYRRDEAVRRPWSEAVASTPDGLPYLAPGLQLLFKSANLRPKDDLDARRVIPTLSAQERRLLGGHLPGDHPWQLLLLEA